MDGVDRWKWILGAAFLAGAAFCSGAETALTSLGEPRARQLHEEGGRRGRSLALWLAHPERVLATLLIASTLVNVGAGALAASIGADLAARWGRGEGLVVAVVTGLATVAVLFLGEIVPKTVARRHPARVAVAAMPAVRALALLLRPIAAATTRIASAVVGPFGGAAPATPAVTSAEIEYLIEMGTREGVLDEVKEELLNSVLEFADRVVKEIMVPRTRMVAIDEAASPEALVRVVAENPFSRMPVYRGTVDEIVGVLLVREIVQELRDGPIRGVTLARHLKPAFFVPEQMKISRLLKEMQRRHVHLAIVVDEFGGTSGLVTLEDVLEEIVGEIQDEGDAEAAPVRVLGDGVWLADAAIPLHDLASFLERHPGAGGGAPGAGEPGVVFPESSDYGTLGGFVTATAGRVPPVGAVIEWQGLAFTVRAGDERRLTRIEIARGGATAPAEPRRAAEGA